VAAHPAFPLTALAAELGQAPDRLYALGDDADPLSDMRTVLSLSYRALSPDAARLFRLLGLAPGYTISSAAAACLAGEPIQSARRLLTQLAQSNLIEQSSPDRYTFHDLLRLYAAERAHTEEDPQEREAACVRLLHHYLHTAEAATSLLVPQKLRLISPLEGAPAAGFNDTAEASAWLDTERANLVAAICHAAEHGPRPVAWLLAESLRVYFWRGMHFADWRITAQAGLSAAEADADPLGQMAALYGVGLMHFREGKDEQSIVWHLRSLELAERNGLPDWQAAVQSSLGAAYRQIGQLRRAADHITEALEKVRRVGTLSGQAVTLLNLGVVKWTLGELTEAAECYSQALTCYRKIRSQSGEAVALGNLAEVWHALGRRDETREHLEESLSLARLVGDRGSEAEGLRLLAAWHRDAGNHVTALELAGAATLTARRGGQPRFESHCLNMTASIHIELGDYQVALDRYRQALELASAAADRFPLSAALAGVAIAHHHLGQPGQALAHAQQALSVTKHSGYRLIECDALRCMATIRLADDPDEAAELARQALEIHAATGYRLGEAHARELYAQASGRAARIGSAP
jgi:tetratricopeptide (TPR) repeat protein